MKVLIMYSKKGRKNPIFSQIETRKYKRYILVGDSLPKLSDMKVYKDNIPLDKKIKIKLIFGNKWIFAKDLDLSKAVEYIKNMDK